MHELQRGARVPGRPTRALAVMSAVLAVAAGWLALQRTAAVASVPVSATRFVAGFEVDKPARVTNASALGVTVDIEYNGPPRPSSKRGKALTAARMTVIDARISDELGEWECHRTHTVAPPPPEEEDWFCKTDEDPSVDSPAVVLEAVRRIVREDAANLLVSGYWVLDDWPQWDGGSARTLLTEIDAAIDEVTPALPAICGFGGTILPIGQTGGFELATAEDYSDAGCDMVGLYDYSEPRRAPSNGANLEWTIETLLAEQGRRPRDDGVERVQGPDVRNRTGVAWPLWQAQARIRARSLQRTDLARSPRVLLRRRKLDRLVGLGRQPVCAQDDDAERLERDPGWHQAGGRRVRRNGRWLTRPGRPARPGPASSSWPAGREDVDRAAHRGAREQGVAGSNPAAPIQ